MFQFSIDLCTWKRIVSYNQVWQTDCPNLQDGNVHGYLEDHEYPKLIS